MLEFLLNLRKIITFAKDSILPAMIFAISLIGFYLFEVLETPNLKVINILFYLCAITSYSVLIYFNKNKGAMFSLIILISYIAINYLKLTMSFEFIHSKYFINIAILTPINLVFFYFLPNNKFITKENTYILLGIFLQIAIVENLSKQNIDLGYNFFNNPNSINHLSIILFAFGTIAILFKSSKEPKIINIYLLFAFLEIMFGFIYAQSATGLSTFFFSAALTILLGICYDTHYETFFDVLTGLKNRNSYMTDADRFPLKYEIGIIHIDDFKRLKTIFNKKELNSLIKMIANKTSEDLDEFNLYRYGDEEFVAVFKNQNFDESFEQLNNMRRKIAAAEFLLNSRKKEVKLTVSGSIASKKRSDANAFIVLARTKKALEETNRFSHNVTSKA